MAIELVRSQSAARVPLRTYGAMSGQSFAITMMERHRHHLEVVLVGDIPRIGAGQALHLDAVGAQQIGHRFGVLQALRSVGAEPTDGDRSTQPAMGAVSPATLPMREAPRLREVGAEPRPQRTEPAMIRGR